MDFAILMQAFFLNLVQQDRLGHKDVKTTINIYAHVRPEKIEETGERFANYVNL